MFFNVASKAGLAGGFAGAAAAGVLRIFLLGDGVLGLLFGDVVSALRGRGPRHEQGREKGEERFHGLEITAQSNCGSGSKV
jgi:hypothetical protein